MTILKKNNTNHKLNTSYFCILSILASALSLFLFYPGLSGGFIFDDIPNIVENRSLHITSLNITDILYATYSFEPGNSSRPLAMLSFALDYWRGGLNATSFKTTNLFLHGFTSIALAYFFRLLLSMASWSSSNAARGGIILAIIWAIHPIQVSSVLYIVQRMQTMGTLFLVLSLLSYLKMRQAQIHNIRSLHYTLLTLLLWILALTSKEDSALLPAYTLGLELFILKFQAGNAYTSMTWRNLYKWLTVIGAIIFLLVIVPHYWHSETYPGRSFSSAERLLTQGRVIATYLTQILFPLPNLMPFYYDDIIVSKNIFQPLTTLPALIFSTLLLAIAWHYRRHRPLFSLGVYLFFAGHFMTSNVINLELAFEHRNHFPLIGALLALFDLFFAVCQRWRITPKAVGILGISISVCLGTATAVRAHSWGEPLRFAQKSVELAPNSARAWLALCTAYFNPNNQREDDYYLDKAISTCSEGAKKTLSAPLFSNIVIFKTIKGNVNENDWKNLLDSLQKSPMDTQNRGIIWINLNNLERKIPLDENGVLKTIEIISERTDFSSNEYLRLAAYIFNETHRPKKAFTYLKRAVETASTDDPVIIKMLKELSEAGREDWAKELSLIAQKRKTLLNE